MSSICLDYVFYPDGDVEENYYVLRSSIKFDFECVQIKLPYILASKSARG